VLLKHYLFLNSAHPLRRTTQLIATQQAGRQEERRGEAYFAEAEKKGQFLVL